MTSRLTSAIVAFGLVLTAFSSRAQYAYNQVPRSQEATVATDAEDGPKTSSYKLIHGVVQGKQGALPGATVWLHGSRNIVVTNAEGEFELRVPADAKEIKLTCGYGGLQEEVITTAPVQSMGSFYLLRAKSAEETQVAVN